MIEARIRYPSKVLEFSNEIQEYLGLLKVHFQNRDPFSWVEYPVVRGFLSSQGISVEILLNQID